MRYRYNISGYIEVEADSAEHADNKVTVEQREGKAPKAFTNYQEKDKTFIFAVAVGLPQQRD